MYNGQIIKQLLAEKNIQNKELLNYLGTEANSSLSQIVNGNPTVRRLEKVADFFGVSMDVFFNREKPYVSIGHTINGNGNKVSGDIQLHECQKEIEHLKELLNEKERLIQVLMKNGRSLKLPWNFIVHNAMR